MSPKKPTSVEGVSTAAAISCVKVAPVEVSSPIS
jgi:hypothetical protein